MSSLITVNILLSHKCLCGYCKTANVTSPIEDEMFHALFAQLFGRLFRQTFKHARIFNVLHRQNATSTVMLYSEYTHQYSYTSQLWMMHSC